MGNQTYVKRCKKATFSLLVIGIIIFFPIQVSSLNWNVYFISNSQLKTSQNEYNNTHYSIERSVNLITNVDFKVKNGPDVRRPCYIEIPLFKKCTPYQEVNLIKSEYTAEVDVDVNNYFDEYNNEFDYFKVWLDPYEEFIIHYEYNINLNYVSFDINEFEIGDYNISDKNFELYCNHPEEKYDTHDPDSIRVSNKIVNSTDNPIEKARKIFKWVTSYLTYEEQKGREKGASWAYDKRKGDCSEYSSLYITLLRIQGIPARKVSGFVFPELSNTQECILKYSKQIDKLNCHAWTEYYLPNSGWIACDPTWNYFNMMDNARISYTKGSKFYFPLDDQSAEFYTTEFTSFAIACFDEQEYEYTVKVEKIRGEIESGGKGDGGVDFEKTNDFDIEDFKYEAIAQYSLICFFIILVGICFLIIVKRRN